MVFIALVNDGRKRVTSAADRAAREPEPIVEILSPRIAAGEAYQRKSFPRASFGESIEATSKLR